MDSMFLMIMTIFLIIISNSHPYIAGSRFQNLEVLVELQSSLVEAKIPHRLVDGLRSATVHDINPRAPLKGSIRVPLRVPFRDL